MRMSPSVEFQACSYYGAGLTEVTAREISETPELTEKNTTQEEIPQKKRGGEILKGEPLNRSAIDEEFSRRGSDQVAEMENPDNQQRFVELAISSNKKDNDSGKVPHSFVNPQLYVGHVKGLQKVFENISSTDDVIHHKVTVKTQQHGSLREKKHRLPQDVPVTPGVHGPIYSKVYNPLRKGYLEKRCEHVTVIDSSESSNTVPTTSQSNIYSNKQSLESKGNADKYIANVELTSGYHSDHVASYSKARIQPPDLKLPARPPTPPPYKTKNNISVSLNSPRGWTNESAIVHTPTSSVEQQFASPRNTSSPVPSQTSGKFSSSGLEIEQKLRKHERNLIQLKGITKSQHRKNSQESSKEELELPAKSNILHVVDEKEALNSRSLEMFGNTISNEIQEESIANENTGLEEIQERFTDKHIAERVLIEDIYCQDLSPSDILQSSSKEVCIEKTTNTSKIDNKLSPDVPPVIIQRKKPPDNLHDAYINRKLENTSGEKLENSNDPNNHNASSLMDLNYTSLANMTMSNENRDDIVQGLQNNKEVKSKFRPTIILHKSVNKVNCNSVNLTKRTNNDESRHYKTSVSNQALEEETKTKQIHQVEKSTTKHAEFLHCEYNSKNNVTPTTNALNENQCTSIVNPTNSLTNQSEGEVLDKGEHIIDLATDIMHPADNEESTTDVSCSADGESNSAPLNKEAIKGNIKQPEMDILDNNNDFVLHKIVDEKEGKTEEGSTIGYSNHEVRKDEGLISQQQHVVSITTINGQTDNLNDIDDMLQKPDHEAEWIHQPVNKTSLSEDGYSNLNDVGRDIMGNAQNLPVSVETAGEQMENVSDISKNSTSAKKTVNIIQENTDEVDINTLNLEYQCILDAAVEKDEPATHLFASGLKVKTEVEQSKELIKSTEYNKDQAAQESTVLIDSSVEMSEQPCNNLKQGPNNMLNTVVNTSHMPHIHMLYQNTAQTGDAIVDHSLQDAVLMSEHRENGKQHASGVINQFVSNNAMEKTVTVGDNHFGMSEQDKDLIIKRPLNESLDQTSEVVFDAAEQTGNISSARESLSMDNGNLTVEHKCMNPQHNPEKVLVENNNFTGEDKENFSLFEISQQIFVKEVVEEPLGKIKNDQVKKMVIDETEAAVCDNEEVAEEDPEEKKHTLSLDISDEIHEHASVNIPNDNLTCRNIKNSTDGQPSENTQICKEIVNQVTDDVSQWKGLADNLPIKEDQAENVNESPTIKLHSSDMQDSLQLLEAKEFQERENIDTHHSNYVFLNKLNGDIPRISLSDVEKKSDTADSGNMSAPSTTSQQVKQNSIEQTTEIFQHSHLSNSGKYINEARVTNNAVSCAKEEETESSENMEIWVSKLRHLETPEFMKHHREPRCSAKSTLPPIKEDQGSPKTDCFDFKVPFSEIKEKNILCEQDESTEKPKVAEQTEKSEQSEKKYSWERNTERPISRSSPMELMRKHYGDEVSRKDSYKNFIAQNLSHRQSSIIGSLLLSERSDKKTDTSEGKSYSILESSFLLRSSRKQQKDKLEVVAQTETVLETATSENDSTETRTNNTSTSTPDNPEHEDSIDSSIQEVDDVTDLDSTKLPPKLDTPLYSPFKVFPDVWHHPEKSHGKLNPRPGKIILFSEPGFKGHSYKIYSDVCNTCDRELQGTISVQIIRGGWLLYEKPHFRGKRVMLSEGDTDLTCPWEAQEKSTENIQENTQKPKSWIGSLRHVVRDFQVPRISLFMEENGEGNKVTVLGATPDARVSGQPFKTESIIVHSGLWLLYSKVLFEGDPYILESGGYPNRKAWSGHDSLLCSLQPARIGGPTVEKPNEPTILLYQHSEFKGHCWEVTGDLHSLQKEPNQQGEHLTSVGSLKVLGGCWVAYEKEGFHGHQYLLEEGEYQKCSQWGSCTEELGSLRHIRTDFSEPEIILYEKPVCLEGSCLRLNEALSDIEVAQYGINTGSIQVLNGVWVAYENVDFSGEQYVLEKGIYHNYHNWGAKDSQICSVQPVLQVGGQGLQYSPKIQLFSEPNFHGDYMTHTEDRVLLPQSFSPQSCRIEGGSWILYEGEDCCGEQYILVEGDYPTRTAMGCHAISILRSLKKVPLYFSIPSISLHGLERFEGKELEFTGAVRSLQGEGYNDHVLSIKVASGIWVLYEHSDFRGRQWLLEKTQITNWLLFSGIQRIGSLCPIRQRRTYFRLRNRALGLFLCVPEPADNMKAARVQVTEPTEGSCDLWYYEEGRIKNQMTPQMTLQVVGTTTPGTKVVMWPEGRKPIQTWSIEDSGVIMSCLFEGLCLDVKGGHSYDSDHVVVWETVEDRLTQHWYLEVF
ncbi:hypothetical protein GDO78_001151 [Eleutherodactylus coqui]|uniref:Beta/gamma crystallin 'Greek key' domain-containing protein n=1 Tax=Eleutherodactylus coqui TaxID=57060 RepID=A0A8J6FU65_ELECQ|nr:hypothetical protein GDO78_001151 [Eleutherodactylus coqui]